MSHIRSQIRPFVAEPFVVRTPAIPKAEISTNVPEPETQAEKPVRKAKEKPVYPERINPSKIIVLTWEREPRPTFTEKMPEHKFVYTAREHERLRAMQYRLADTFLEQAVDEPDISFASIERMYRLLRVFYTDSPNTNLWVIRGRRYATFEGWVEAYRAVILERPRPRGKGMGSKKARNSATSLKRKYTIQVLRRDAAGELVQVGYDRTGNSQFTFEAKHPNKVLARLLRTAGVMFPADDPRDDDRVRDEKAMNSDIMLQVKNFVNGIAVGADGVMPMQNGIYVYCEVTQ